MSRLAGMIAAFLMVYCSANATFAQRLATKDLRETSDVMPGERRLQRTIEVGPGTRMDATIEETNKGNGLLTIGNLRLKVVDSHGDGAVYQDGMPNVEFADIDGDGWKDLVVSGIVNYSDEKGVAIRKRESFTFIFRFDPRTKTFRQTYKHASFKLEDGPHDIDL